MKKIIKIIFFIIAILVIFIYIIFAVLTPMLQNENKIVMAEIDYFQGNGTEESPYLINNNMELIRLSELVNSGKEFRDIYFKQMKDLNLGNVEQFIPIGIYKSNKYFYGVYDGGGHSIYNLNIDGDKMEHGNVALFGQLGGTVKNLGIESGFIQGFCIGSIASHAASDEAKIINCYNKATLKASLRAGGIADNFGRGQIINCWNEGDVEAPETGGIISYTARMIYNSYCVQEKIMNEHFSGTIKSSTGGYTQSKEDLLQKMNAGTKSAIAAFGLKEDSLNQWELNDDSITFKRSEN